MKNGTRDVDRKQPPAKSVPLSYEFFYADLHSTTLALKTKPAWNFLFGKRNCVEGRTNSEIDFIPSMRVDRIH